MENNLKKLWIDTETTGLIPGTHGIIQLGMLVDIGGRIVDKASFQMCPTGRVADDEALKVNGYTRGQIRGFSPYAVVYPQVVSFLTKYVDKYSPEDKFIACGQNVRFDVDMMLDFFQACGDQYFFSLVKSGAYIDTLYIMTFLQDLGKIPLLASRKLEMMGKHFGINTDGAHDALFDVALAREIYLKMRGML